MKECVYENNEGGKSGKGVPIRRCMMKEGDLARDRHVVDPFVLLNKCIYCKAYTSIKV